MSDPKFEWKGKTYVLVHEKKRGLCVDCAFLKDQAACDAAPQLIRTHPALMHPVANDVSVS